MRTTSEIHKERQVLAETLESTDLECDHVFKLNMLKKLQKLNNEYHESAQLELDKIRQ